MGGDLLHICFEMHRKQREPLSYRAKSFLTSHTELRAHMLIFSCIILSLPNRFVRIGFICSLVQFVPEF